MKKLPVILNAVLLAAVVVLYILYFANPEKKEASGQDQTVVNRSSLENAAIAYVEFDTILTHYDRYIDLQGELVNKQKKSEAQLTSKSDTWQRAVKDYQDKANKGLITRSKMMEIEAQLSKDQKDLLTMRDDLSASLAEEKQVTDRQVMNKIIEYLKKYNADNHYQFIFSKSFGGNLLLAETGNDITAEVLQGLNKEYQKEQKSK